MNTETFQDVVEVIKKKKKKLNPVSVATLASTVKERATADERIMAFIRQNPGSTREEIVEGTGIKWQTVTGNIAHLIGNHLIEQCGTKPNKQGREVGRLWRVTVNVLP